ncbi:Ig domain-containing protein [Rummeliibacillus sp. TYF-LIM-RU47]|uniref:Ig domain-containing protein n=1 Tax=Rummeliibacillus sp. TYF-LIM-RU47 TaxID=2608406 RepID=UPI00123A94F2|nr:Ig domain-containing protein [Rummeliibacillus sp. TYF-LIM-RU47]
MDFFSNLKEKEDRIELLEQLKEKEKELYYEREKLFETYRETSQEPIGELVLRLETEFKEIFSENNFILDSNPINNKIITLNSKTISVTLENTNDGSFSFRLTEKDTNDYSNNLYYTIQIEETDETRVICEFMGNLNDNDEFEYIGTYPSDDIEHVRKQIQKLESDIKKITSADPTPNFVYKLGDDKYSYLGKEFFTVRNLFNEILSKYKF